MMITTEEETGLITSNCDKSALIGDCAAFKSTVLKIKRFPTYWQAYILKVQKSADSAFQSQKICGKSA